MLRWLKTVVVSDEEKAPVEASGGDGELARLQDQGTGGMAPYNAARQRPCPNHQAHLDESCQLPSGRAVQSATVANAPRTTLS